MRFRLHLLVLTVKSLNAVKPPYVGTISSGQGQRQPTRVTLSSLAQAFLEHGSNENHEEALIGQAFSASSKHLELRVRQEEYKRMEAMLDPPCYNVPGTGDKSAFLLGGISGRAEQKTGMEIQILASRPKLINASLNSWMLHLPKDWHVTCLVDRGLYLKDKEAWDAIPLPIETFTTTATKNAYARAAEVYIAAIRKTAQLVQRGQFKSHYYHFVDDDTFINPYPIANLLSTKHSSEQIVLAKGNPKNIYGGEGIIFSRRSLELLTTECMNPCAYMMYGDLALSAILQLGRNWSGAEFNTPEIYGSKAIKEMPGCALLDCSGQCKGGNYTGSPIHSAVYHHCSAFNLMTCGKTCEGGLTGWPDSSTTGWKPAGNHVKENKVC